MAGSSENIEYDPSKDPKRKAKSDDPAWKYCFWPDLTNKDMVECTLCGKKVRSGVKRLKQHLAGTTFGDVTKCPKATIRGCSNGHALCSGCKPKVHNRCPICRHELGNIRCLALEKVGASLELSCQYQSFGCVGIFPYYSKLNHETQCAFRPYNCPYSRSECPVVGDIHYLVDHLKDDHKVDIHNGNTFSHQYVESNPHEAENATRMLKVSSCFGQYFSLHFEAFQLGTEPTYLAFLRFMGNDNDAKKYRYSLVVRGNGRQITWHGVPRSIRHNHSKFSGSFDGIVIQRDEAIFLSRGDPKELKLCVTGRIQKEQ